jgi:hypothetical protein
MLDTGSSVYTNQPLPYINIPSYSVLPFWDDLYVFVGTPQGVFYQVNGTIVTFEYYLSHYQDSSEFYHFEVSYDSTRPGIFQFDYFDISDLGISATVGAQGDISVGSFNDNGTYVTNGSYIQYSYNSPVILPGLTILLDTNSNTISTDAV